MTYTDDAEYCYSLSGACDMEPRRFINSPAGRVLKAQQGEATYWAFVPNPLPPELPLDMELWSTLSEADRHLGELAGLGRNIPNPQLLIGPFIRREAVLSSRIEGTQADIRDLYTYEAQQLALPGFTNGSREEADVREVWNYVRALEYGLARLGTLPISLRLIKELHTRLMTGVRGQEKTPGEFRNSQNWIGGSNPTNAKYVPPPMSEMITVLGDLEKYIHQESDIPPLIRLAYIHYQFEAVHPFLDGNGRVGRLMITLLLVHWNLLPQPLLYLSAFFERHHDDYVDLLLNVSETGGWRAWVVFFLRGVAEQARDANSRLKQIQDLQTRWKNQLQSTRATGTFYSALDYLFEQPALSAGDLQQRLSVTHQTAMKLLRGLEDMGIVEEITGKERRRLYLASEIVKVME